MVDGGRRSRAHAGAKFAKLFNEAAATSVTAVALPPRLVASAWLPNRNGATRLDIAALREDHPMLPTLYSFPDVGPPCLTTDMVHVLPTTPDTDSETLPHRQKAPSPPPTHRGFLTPQVPGETSDIPPTQPKNWRHKSPSPDALNKPEMGWNPSRQDEVMPETLKRHPPTRDEGNARMVRRTTNTDAYQIQAVRAPNPEEGEDKAPAGAAPVDSRAQAPTPAFQTAPHPLGTETPRMLPSNQNTTSAQTPNPDSQRMLSSQAPRMLSPNQHPASAQTPNHGAQRMLSSETPRTLPDNHQPTPAQTPKPAARRRSSSQTPSKPAPHLYGPRDLPDAVYRNDAVQHPVIPAVTKSRVRPPGLRPHEPAAPSTPEFHNIVHTAVPRALSQQSTDGSSNDVSNSDMIYLFDSPPEGASAPFPAQPTL